MTTKEQSVYKCDYCHKGYKREAAFINHECKQMRREKELRTPLGQAAWQFYQEWMRAQHKRVPDTRAYLKSRSYEPFRRFAAFVKDADIPKPQTFIRLMVKLDFPPYMWHHNEVYSKYLEYIELQLTPSEQLEITLEVLYNKTDEYDCKIKEIFEHINPSEVIELIKQKKLSPWLLLMSIKFCNFMDMVYGKNREQYIILEHLLRPKFWTEQFEQDPASYKTAKRLVAKLEL